jgi:tRNA threonylcarbamoyladenosine modification (KEOPS) complex  Pcc1 subunit
MNFRAELVMSCADPEVIKMAIVNDDLDTESTSVTYAIRDSALGISVESGDLRLFNKALSSVLNRFKLACDAHEMCEKEKMPEERSRA